MEKLICYTLDLEKDFGGRINSYSSLDDLTNFQYLVKKNKIRLTTFAAGHLLHEKNDAVKKLLDIGSKFELHSYSHNVSMMDEELEIKKSKKAYLAYFKRKPLGYRSPKGMITKKGLRILASEGFKFDSSIYPTIAPGRYNNLKYPNSPYYYKDFGIIELPFSVVPIIRLPLAMSYLQPIGLRLSKRLIDICGLPNIVVFGFHMWNLYKPANSRKLPLKWKLLLARNLDSGMETFEELTNIFLKKGYKPIYIEDLYEIARKDLNNKRLRPY